MTEAEDKLLTAAIENWITGKYSPLIKAVLEEREHAPGGDVLIRMPAEDWRILTDTLREKNAQLGHRAWMIVAKIEAELPTRCVGCGNFKGTRHDDHCKVWNSGLDPAGII